MNRQRPTTLPLIEPLTLPLIEALTLPLTPTPTASPGTYSLSGKEPLRAYKSEAERTLDSLQYFRNVKDSLKPMVPSSPKDAP